MTQPQYIVLAQSTGPDNSRLVLVPLWTTATAANDELLAEDLTKDNKE